LPRRRHDAAGDPLVRHVVARLAPPTQPRLKQRPQPGAPRRRGSKRQRLSLRAAVRRWTDLLAVWRHCKECRDRRRCHGDPLTCLPCHLPHLAPPARLWFACIGVAAEKNVSFAEALTLTEGNNEQACARWHAAVDDALRRTDDARKR